MCRQRGRTLERIEEHVQEVGVDDPQGEEACEQTQPDAFVAAPYCPCPDDEDDYHASGSAPVDRAQRTVRDIRSAKPTPQRYIPVLTSVSRQQGRAWGAHPEALYIALHKRTERSWPTLSVKRRSCS